MKQLNTSTLLNRTLFLSQLAKTESNIVDMQVHNFDKLKNSLRKGNAIDPKTRIYLTNKAKDVYELKMKENKDEMFDIDVSFEEIFQEKQNKYDYYYLRYNKSINTRSNSNCNSNSSNGSKILFNKRKGLSAVKINEYYRKLKTIPNKTFNGVSKIKLSKQFHIKNKINGGNNNKLPFKTISTTQYNTITTTTTFPHVNVNINVDNINNNINVIKRKNIPKRKTITAMDVMESQIQRQLKALQKKYPFIHKKRLKEINLSDLMH